MKFKARKDIGTTYLPKRAHMATGVTRKQERSLRRMAAMIQNEPQLLSIMMQTKAEFREAGLERIRPYLLGHLRNFRLPEATS